MHGHRHLVVALSFVAFSCFSSKQPNGDGAVDGPDVPHDVNHPDSLVDGGPIGRCEIIGGIHQCWPECGECPDGTTCSRAPFYALCTGDVLGCFGGAGYCVESERYCFRGTCMPAEFCADVHRTEIEDRCTYNAGEIYVTGPPSEACPAPLDPLSTYCGEACAPCSTEPIFFSGSFSRCVGLNDDRGLGLCGLSNPCDAESGPTLDLYAEVVEDPICLVEIGVAGLEPIGYLVAGAACAAYIAKYPGDFSCVDPRVGWRAR